ncbi:hypothetical protein N7471_001365 [Penicillium samsonianum]|uniref:uncharacterized protein n=1 Tax=Penicillium samsonianum TaxID=1882272 RepID=UPI002546921E|nr:uncharacterized protein N7471_001365 [Penicillium samsonianum]KAJ6150166.1 hypothetical protein N7471_001365 [Penicillium samsonianum]
MAKFFGFNLPFCEIAPFWTGTGHELFDVAGLIYSVKLFGPCGIASKDKIRNSLGPDSISEMSVSCAIAALKHNVKCLLPVDGKSECAV